MAATVLEIDLGALAHNFNYLKSKIQPGVKLLAVAKAFGYGSDATAVALRLENLGVDYFAVAYVSEGIELRKAGIATPILVLHPQVDTFEDLIKYELEPNLYSFRTLNAFIRLLNKKASVDYPIHLKFNTGLNRLGFKPGNEAKILSILQADNSVYVKSLFSHLVASEDPVQRDFTLGQIASFKACIAAMASGLGYNPLTHQSNTSGILNYPEAQFDMVRTGIGLYGYGNSLEEDRKLKPVATLKTIISQIHDIEKGESVGYNLGYIATKPTRSATLPIGHADGISRAYGKGKGYATISGKKAPILGNVCMDMIMVDVTNISCAEGDEVIVFGKGAYLPELTRQIDSITYELLTAISQRVKRIIIN